MSTYLKKGEWNAICDRCGFQYKSGQLKETWDKLKVCRDCWEPRHPQDFVRGIRDDEKVEWTRTEPTDIEVDTSGWVTPDSVPEGTFNSALTELAGYFAKDYFAQNYWADNYWASE